MDHWEDIRVGKGRGSSGLGPNDGGVGCSESRKDRRWGKIVVVP